MSPREWRLLLALSVVWGGSFSFQKLALCGLPPFTIALARVGLAALTLQLVLHASGQRPRTSGAPWPAFAVMGLLNNVIPFSLLLWGQTYVSSGTAAILNASTPCSSPCSSPTR